MKCIKEYIFEKLILKKNQNYDLFDVSKISSSIILVFKGYTYWYDTKKYLNHGGSMYSFLKYDCGLNIINEILEQYCKLTNIENSNQFTKDDLFDFVKKYDKEITQKFIDAK
jgi:hypothetical protein